MTTPHPAGTGRPPFADDTSTRWYHRPFGGATTLFGGLATLFVSVVVGLTLWWAVNQLASDDVRLAVPSSVAAGERLSVGAPIARDWLCSLRVTYPDGSVGEDGDSTWSDGTRFWQVVVPLDTTSGGADIAMTCANGEHTQTGSATVAVVAPAP